MAEFDPSTVGVDDVLKKLEKADEAERTRILNAERAGKARKTILEPYGLDSDARVDDSGRVLYPWEVAPESQVVPVVVEEDAEAKKARELQAEQDAQVAAARPARDEQGGNTSLGDAPAPAVPTSGNTSAGAPTA